MKCNRKGKRNNGFTLAELMLVLMIMAVMTTVIIVSGRGIITYVNETLTITEAQQYKDYAQVVFNQHYMDSEEVNLTIDSKSEGNRLYQDFVEKCGKPFADDNEILVTAGANGEITDFQYLNGKRNILVTWDQQTDTLEANAAAPAAPAGN